MPRWLAIIVSLVLFAVIMLALRWVLLQILPGIIAWAEEGIGSTALWTVLVVVWVIAGAVAYLGHRRHAQRGGAEG